MRNAKSSLLNIWKYILIRQQPIKSNQLKVNKCKQVVVSKFVPSKLDIKRRFRP